MWTTPLIAAGLAFSFFGVSGQDAPPADPARTDDASSPAAALDDVMAGIVAANPLLREGSDLVEAQGVLQRDAQRSQWSFNVIDDSPAAGYTLTIMPCTRLAEMEQVLEAVGERRVVFEVTGRIFVFDDRNFLLPTTAVRLVGEAPEPATPDRDAADAPAADESDPTRPPTTEEIIRQLEDAVGRPSRSTAGASDDTGANAAASDELVREGTSLVQRRGRMVRDRSGAWRFVFDADAEGLADPPMLILPCRLLEQMRAHAVRAGSDVAMLVSGEVFVYRGRNYILPSVYLIPPNRSRLGR